MSVSYVSTVVTKCIHTQMGDKLDKNVLLRLNTKHTELHVRYIHTVYTQYMRRKTRSPDVQGTLTMEPVALRRNA